jgi:hypothetical protein
MILDQAPDDGFNPSRGLFSGSSCFSSILLNRV